MIATLKAFNHNRPILQSISHIYTILRSTESYILTVNKKNHSPFSYSSSAKAQADFCLGLCADKNVLSLNHQIRMTFLSVFYVLLCFLLMYFPRFSLADCFV